MTHSNDHDFQQFRGAFDNAMTPDAAFMAKMERLLQSEKPIDAERTSTVLASPPRETRGSVVPPRRSHPLMVAAAVLTVIAVTIASVWVLSGDVLEGEYANAPSGIATLPADAPGMPGEDVQLESELLIHREDGSYIIGVFDGVIYTTHNGPDTESNEDLSTSFVTATDAETGDQLWQIEGFSLWELRAADGVLVSYGSVFVTPVNSAEGLPGGEQYPKTTIVALNAETGELLWEQEQPEEAMLRMMNYNLVTLGGTVMVVSPEGSISALDLHTGDSVWESMFDPGEGWPTEIQRGSATISTQMYSFSITEWQEDIAIANSDGLVQVLDGDTGEHLNSHQIPGANSPGYISLNPLPNGLLLTSGGGSYQMVAFDPETGDVFWEREFDGDITVEVSPNGNIAVNSHIWDSGSFIMRLIGRGGHSTHQFLWIDGMTGEDVLTTERGRVDNPVFMTTDDVYMCMRATEFVCYDASGTRYVLEDGPWAYAFLSNGVMYFDGPSGVYRVEMP